MGLLGLPVPGPSDAVRAATGAYAALDQAVSLVPRVAALLSRLERLADRAEAVIDRVDEVVDLAHGTVERVDGVVGSAEVVVGRTTGVVDAAARTVERTEGVVDGAEVVVGRTSGTVDAAEVVVGRTAGVVDGAAALLSRSDELVGRIVATTSDEELEAIVHLIDTLPQAVDALRNDVLPVMSTLGTVAPDLRDLLDIASQLNGVLGSVPGLGRIKRRVEKEQAEEDSDSYRADEEPPSAPERGE